MPEDCWFIRIAGKQQGPYSREQLQVLIRRGVFGRMHEASTDGVKWVRAATLTELFAMPRGAVLQPSVSVQQPQAAGQQPQAVQPTPATIAGTGQESAPLPSKLWYVARGDDQKGSFNWEALLAQVGAGVLLASDLVWTEGMPNWVPASQVADLQQAISAREKSALSTLPQQTIPVARLVKSGDDKTWRYTQGGVPANPISATELKQMAAAGRISPFDMLWQEGMPAWVPASQIGWLFAASPAVAMHSTSSTVTVRGRSLSRRAGRGSRLGAVMLDGLVCFGAFLPGILVMVSTGGRNYEVGIVGALLVFVCIVGLAIYQCVLLSTQGQTIGKRMLNLRIVREVDDGNPGFAQVIIMRFFLPGLIGGIPVIGVIFSLADILFIFGEDRRCIHDLMAGTKVVETS